MKARCYNPNHKGYARYGARGITVCVSWLDSFDAFLRDMGTKPFRDDLLGRVNKHLGYYKANCEWVSALANNRNRDDILKVRYEGEEMLLSEASDLSGIRYQTLRNRIFVNKWPEADWFLPPNSRK